VSKHPGRSLLVALALLWYLGAGVPGALAAGGAPANGDGPDDSSVPLHMSPRVSPGLLALEGAFRRTLTGAVADPVSFYSEYFEQTPLGDDESLQKEIAAYLRAKYRGMRLDLVAVTSSRGLRFAVRHRDQLFPRVPVVFAAVDRAAAGAIALGDGISGVWLSQDWAGTLDGALRLQPDTEQAVVVTGASPLAQVWSAAARSQLERPGRPIAITYVIGSTMEDVLARLAALPDRSIVLLGPFGRDAAGRDFRAPEVGARIARASAVPVYTVVDGNIGSGVVGGRVVSFEAQGARQAEIGARLLAGERPALDESGTSVYRFDARQLRRFHLDTRQLPPGSAVLFDEPSVWQEYRGYIVGAVGLLGLQTWLIIALLANRSQRRGAERALAERLHFETLVSNVLATLVAPSPGEVDTRVERAMALIAAHLDVDRVVLGERNDDKRALDVTHTWTREGSPPMPVSVAWRAFPWVARRVREGHIVAVSPRHPLPPEAETDRRSMLELGTRSLLALPLLMDGVVIGVLSCATARDGREWPDDLIERLRLLAEVLANTLARRRAETAVRASEERLRGQREELAHALRVNTLGEFGVSLAHEINQPLTAIVVNARAMTGLLAGGPDERATAVEALADIAADAKRAGAIIERLRALSRKEPVPREGLDLDGLVDEVVSLLRQGFVIKRIKVRRLAGPPLPPVAGDPIQLQQVFLNVLVNAAEAIVASGSGEREIVVASAHPAPGLVEIAITDSGDGGKDVDLERMFESFVSTKPGGLGMGLAISRSIVEAHGGRIYAKANVERGLTVHVELPVQPRGA
jgi:signal transduction histidine kinase